MKSQTRKKPKILVVDDERDNLDLLYRTLRRDYRVFRADNGPNALEILSQEADMSVIISDQRMPIMTGTEFLSLTAVQYPNIIRILLTGYTDVDDLVEAINSGKVFKYITKPWDAEDLMGIVSQALETHEVLKKRTDELNRSLSRESLLNTVTNTIRNAHSQQQGNSPLQEVLQTIVDTVGQTLNADLCLLQMVADPPEPNATVSQPLPAPLFAYQQSQAAPLSSGELAPVIWPSHKIEVFSRSDLIAETTSPETNSTAIPTDPQRLVAFEQLGIQSTIIVPLMSQGKLLAVMALHHYETETAWADDEIQLVVMVADQAALAISQAQAYETVQSLAKRAELVNTITAAIRSSLEPERIFMAITRQLGQTLDVEGCAISLWTETDEYVQCVGLYDCHAPEDTSLPQSVAPIAGNPLLQDVLKTKSVVVVSDQVAEKTDQALPLRARARALLLVPLLVDGEIIGSISLRQSTKPRQWSTADIELAQDVAAQAAIAVQQSRLFQTTRQQAERLLELDRQKNEFFQNISHELRTPLTLMIGPLEGAISKQADLPLAQSEIALRNSRRLLRLVNQLLDLQRLDAGRMQPTFVPCSLPEFTEQIVAVFQPYCDRKQIHLQLQLSDCPTVYLDLEKFDKVLYNLLSNAMKFTPAQGQITVTVAPNSSGAVTVSVADTGMGITPDQLPVLFERFRQAEGSVNRSYEGTGLGLALVKEIVELHGGQITVESVHQKHCTPEQTSGTTFSVALLVGAGHLNPDFIDASPASLELSRSAIELADLEAELQELQLREKPTESIDAIAEAEINPDGDPILVVDDNPDLRRYIGDMLRTAGYQVYTACNGAEGYERAVAHHPKVVVSDLMMPEVSGLDLIQMVRENEELRGTPIILLTAKADDTSRIAGTEQGADAYLAKPFNDRELLAQVRNLLALKENEERVTALNTYLTEAVLKRFLPPEMVSRAATGDMALDLDPEPRLVTILFSDIVGFTPLSGRLQAQGIAQLLNEYLETMTQVVFENGGVVDKFVGDAVIALFGAPEPLPPEVQVERAISTARQMYERLDQLNASWQQAGIVGASDQPPLVQFRCGIHQGEAVVGLFGSEHRSDYTAIGPAVNIAARLQDAADPNTILVSAQVAEHLTPEEIEQFESLHLKGVEEAVQAFWVTKR
ncbi:MAG: response regulator [Spirulina sp. SIO3F2]|nr:response regulator [Spirulina sp. SIO3F2]